MAQQAEEKATRAENDRREKGKPYEADRLFMYLWNRRFLTPDYPGGWLSRQLDNWVAKIIDFQRNRANYYMLLELPRRLREHAIKVQQTAQLEVQALQTMERQAAEADGVLDLQAKVQEAEKQLKQLDANIAAEESRHQKLLAEEAEFNAGKDPLSQQIIEIQASALEKEPLATLYRRARATPPPEDDVLVGRIHQLSQRQEQIVDEIQSLNALLQQQQRDLGELEEVRRRYRDNGYDAYNSRFPGDFSLGVLLGQMLGGLGNPDTVWGEIDRHHRAVVLPAATGAAISGDPVISAAVLAAEAAIFIRTTAFKDTLRQFFINLHSLIKAREPETKGYRWLTIRLRKLKASEKCMAPSFKIWASRRVADLLEKGKTPKGRKGIGRGCRHRRSR